MFDTHKTRMTWPPCGKETMTICYAISIEYRNVTDGRTDRQTDRQNCYINTEHQCTDARQKLSHIFHHFTDAGVSAKQSKVGILSINVFLMVISVVQVSQTFVRLIKPSVQSCLPNFTISVQKCGLLSKNRYIILGINLPPKDQIP